MADRTGQFVFVGFWTRVFAALIDVAVGWASAPIVFPMMLWSFEHRSLVPYIGWSTLWMVLWIWFVVRFGGTPGKLVVKARIVDADGRFLSWGRAILRALPALVIEANSLAQIGAVIGRYPDTAPRLSFLDIGRLMNEYGQPYAAFGMALGFFIYIDIGAVLFNRQKRALHDFIAGSYVITRASYQAVAEQRPGDAAENPVPQP